MGEAFITRRGGGGPAGLNFEIVGGTTQPTNPKENTIWVNTAQDIHRWDFNAANPYLVSKTKNLNCYPFYDPSRTINGITYTDNGDGTVKANGTATADATFRLSFVTAAANAVYLPAGNYFLSGCPAGGSSAKYRVECKSVTTGEILALDYGSGAAFTLDVPHVVRCNIVVASGATVSSLTFTPQLEKGTAATSFVMGDATGQVWLSNGKESPVEFNALKKNGIQIYPVSAQQYIDGEWTALAAKTYQGGAWVDWWAGELYSYGNEYENVTGGWALSTNWVITHGGTLTKESESMTFESHLVDGSHYAKGFLRPNNKIDLTNYDSLILIAETVELDSTSYPIKLCAKSTDNAKEEDVVASANLTATTSQKTFTLDVSTLTGSYYVGIEANASYGGKVVVLAFKME